MDQAWMTSEVGVDLWDPECAPSREAGVMDLPGIVAQRRRDAEVKEISVQDAVWRMRRSALHLDWNGG